MSLKDKVVQIAYELKDKFSAKTGKVTGSIRDIGNESDKTSSKISKNNAASNRSFDTLLGGANKLKLGFIALGGVIVGALRGISAWTQAAGVQERAETKLATSLRNLTGATNEQIQALKDQASAVQQATGYGDELILSAQAQLATFQLTAEQIGQLTPLLVDMGESQRKLGQENVDLESTALALGKAFTSGIGALSRYGVALTDAEKAAFKLGDQQTKVDIIAQALESNFGGLAAAVGKEYEGAARKAEAAQGDFNEEMGKAFTQNKDFIEFINRMGEGWVSLAESIKESSEGINATLSFVFRSIKTFTGSVKVLFNFFQITLKGLFAGINDTLALFALGLSKITFGSVSDEFERVANSLASTSAGLKKSLSEDYFDDIGKGANDVVDAITGMDEKLASQAAMAKIVAEARADVEEKAAARAKAALERKASADVKSAEATNAAAKALADAKKAEAKALEDSLSRSQKAMEKDLATAKDIAAEFQQLIDDVSGGGAKNAEDLTIIDFASSITNAQNALRAGDFDGAINGAKATADVIRKLKDEGTESDIVLTGLAQKLKRFAQEAAAAKLEQSQSEVGKANQALQAKADDSPIATKLILDTTEAEQQLDALVQKASASITKQIFVNAAGNSFSDRQNNTQAIFKEEALKKGKR